MNFLIKIIVLAIASFGLTYVLDGIHADSFGTALAFALVLAILNVFVKPVFVLLTLPVTIVTLGIFHFIISALMVLLASKFVNGFRVNSFWWALLFSLLLSIVSSRSRLYAGVELVFHLLGPKFVFIFSPRYALLLNFPTTAGTADDSTTADDDFSCRHTCIKPPVVSSF
jgi:putative membrane protein